MFISFCVELEAPYLVGVVLAGREGELYAGVEVPGGHAEVLVYHLNN